MEHEEKTEKALPCKRKSDSLAWAHGQVQERGLQTVRLLLLTFKEVYS